MLPFFYFGDLLVPSYFFVISIAFSASSYWFLLRSHKYSLSANRCLDLCLIIMLSSFIGARLMHVFYEHPILYFEHPMEIFKFWKGGFVFYGGVILAVLSTYLYLKSKKENYKDWLNAFAPTLAFGYVLGRFATLLSGSGFGRPTDLPWGIIYPLGPEAPSGVALHPTPIYSMLWHSIGLLIILKFERSSKNIVAGSLMYFYMIWYGLGRFTIEQFRDDFRGSEIFGLSVSSVISGALIFMGFYLLRKNSVRFTKFFYFFKR